tara:strand:- start:2438 stop:2710 length:273 start_codon:yes stop_codon:yes gene_type:complete
MSRLYEADNYKGPKTKTQKTLFKHFSDPRLFTNRMQSDFSASMMGPMRQAAHKLVKMRMYSGDDKFRESVAKGLESRRSEGKEAYSYGGA